MSILLAEAYVEPTHVTQSVVFKKPVREAIQLVVEMKNIRIGISRAQLSKVQGRFKVKGSARLMHSFSRALLIGALLRG